MHNLFTIDRYHFFIYTDEHRPIRIHIQKGKIHARIEVEDDVETLDNDGLSTKELAKIERIVHEKRDEITKAWHEFNG